MPHFSVALWGKTSPPFVTDDFRGKGGFPIAIEMGGGGGEIEILFLCIPNPHTYVKCNGLLKPKRQK